MLERAGFADAKAYGSFDGEPFTTRRRDVATRSARCADVPARSGCPRGGTSARARARPGRSAPIWAFRRSSRSESRCCAPPAGHERVEARRACSCRSSRRACRGRRAKREHGAQHAVAVAAALDRGRDGVDADDEVLHVGVDEDHPAVAELVVGGGDGGAGLLAGALHDLLHVAHDALEVGGRERLEDDRGLAGGLELELHLELHVRRRHREQAVRGRLLELRACRGGRRRGPWG